MLAQAVSGPPLPVTRIASARDLCLAVSASSAFPGSYGSAGLDRVLLHDSRQGLLEVQAGVPWSALGEFRGTSQFSGTVGETAAHNRPGLDGQPLVAHLRALTIATADGQLRRVSRARSPELFALAVGGLGTFGPFYSLTLDLASLARAYAAPSAPVRLDVPPPDDTDPHMAVELLVPPERVDGVANRTRDTLAQRHCALALMEARLALPESVTFLRWARRDYALLRVEFRVRATLGASVAGAQLCRRLLELAIEAGGAFMPACLPFATRAQALACFPMLPRFLAEKRRLDPEDRVRTTWARDAARIWRGETCRARFCAPEARYGAAV